MTADPADSVQLDSDDDRSARSALDRSDPDVTLRLELGQVALSDEELRQVREGHIVPLDAEADGDILVMVDEQVAARGRLVVVNEQLCVQLTEVLTSNLFEHENSQDR
jgi:flagellar motor switch protein FliN/FliY